MVVDIKTIVRQVRGASQGYQVQGSDQHFYIAKFVDNPQGTRTLINEWVEYLLFQRLEVSSPPLRILRLSQAKRDETGLCFSTDKRMYVHPGLHLGSQLPVNPTKTAIFDFLPSKLFSAVVNVQDFAKAFVVDRLLGQTDYRQCVFTRERGVGHKRLALRAYMIDHGGIFGASQWVIRDLPYLVRPFDAAIYSMLDMHSLCGQTVEMIRKLNMSELHREVTKVPSTWFAERDYNRLADLFTEVDDRLTRLPSIISWHLRHLIPTMQKAVKVDVGKLVSTNHLYPPDQLIAPEAS
jgi:hypothetical protein